jgi:hypothetical protein
VGRSGFLGAVVILVAAWVASPAGARADGPSPQLASLAQMAIDVTVDRLTLEDHFLIRMHDAPPAVTERKLVLPAQSREVVALLSSGLDLAPLHEEATPVLLQFRPNFSRKGGLLRCTFRF